MASRALIEEKLRKMIPAFRFIPRHETSRYLKSLNINLDEHTCFKCGRKLSLDTIGVLFDDGTRIAIVCSECLRKYNIFALYREFVEKAEEKSR